MSYELQDRVWEIDLSSSAKLVLLALAYRADASGSCYPSLSGLCNLTGMDVKTIRKAIRSLVAEGLLEVVERGGRSPLYRVTPTKNGTAKFGTPPNINPSQNWEDTPTKNGRTPLPNLVPEQVNNKSITSQLITTTEEKDFFSPLQEQIDDVHAKHIMDIVEEGDRLLNGHEMVGMAKSHAIYLTHTPKLDEIAKRRIITVSLFNACVEKYRQSGKKSPGWLVGIVNNVSLNPEPTREEMRKAKATYAYSGDEDIPF